MSFKKQFKDIQDLNTKPEPSKVEKKASTSPYDEYLEMLNSSFINLPLMQDQDVIDIKCPLPVDDAIGLSDLPSEKKSMQEQEQVYRYFPTSAMFNRQTNFMRMDNESLFFAFYYQQGTY